MHLVESLFAAGCGSHFIAARRKTGSHDSEGLRLVVDHED
jgi:hypothetical protein